MVSRSNLSGWRGVIICTNNVDKRKIKGNNIGVIFSGIANYLGFGPCKNDVIFIPAIIYYEY